MIGKLIQILVMRIIVVLCIAGLAIWGIVSFINRNDPEPYVIKTSKPLVPELNIVVKPHGNDTTFIYRINTR